MIIAMDGPAGSGKSTVSRLVAARLGSAHLDTGAFYRAASLAVLRARVDPSDHAAVARVVTMARLDQRDGVQLLDGANVADQIRSPEVTRMASPVAAIPEVRRILVQAQRRWVADMGGDVVVEGRDIGTVVFPDAALKVFLTADPGERARRRAAETGEDPVEVETSIRARDQFDSTRAASPLRPAQDAVIVDTTGRSIDQVVDEIVHLAQSSMERA